MNDKISARQAADGVQNLAKSYASVIALGQYVGQIADLEAYRAELEKGRDKALADAQEANAALEKAYEALSEANARVNTAKAEAETIITEANESAGRIRANSSLVAADLVAKATDEANGVRQDFADEKAALDKTRKNLQAEVDALLSTKQSLQADIEAIKAKLG